MANIRQPKYKHAHRNLRVWKFARRIKLSFNKLNLKVWDHDIFIINRFGGKFNNRIRATVWKEYFLEKQAIKAFYGNLSESYIQKINNKNKNHKLLITELETRLDVMVFKLNWALSIYHAKQIISQGNILVNGEKMTIPSYRLKIKDRIQVSKKIQSRQLIKSYIKIRFKKYKLIFSKIYTPHFKGGYPNLKNYIWYWFISPFYLDIHYETMSTTLGEKNQEEKILFYHPSTSQRHLYL